MRTRAEAGVAQEGAASHVRVPAGVLRRPPWLNRLALACAVLLAAACASSRPDAPGAGDPLAALENAGARIGLAVAAPDGRLLEARRAEERFQPASNVKLFTTAAVFHAFTDPATPDPAMASFAALAPRGQGEAPDLVLFGGGDPMLGDGPDCVSPCLAELADAVVAAGVTRVNDVIGDASLFPDEPAPPGWSSDDLTFYFGAPVSALTVNENSLSVIAAPGAASGAPVRLDWAAWDDLHLLQNDALTAPGGPAALRAEVLRGVAGVRVWGRAPTNGAPVVLRLAVRDPETAAAQRFGRLLSGRGVNVEGEPRARRRPRALADEPELRADAPISVSPPTNAIARLEAAPLTAASERVNEDSVNVAAELLLRRLGRIRGTGSREDGLSVVDAMLAEAGLGEDGVDLADGSGLSVYNRATPAAVARFLVWAGDAPWGQAWINTLPGDGRPGEDALARELAGSPLQGRVRAKTGTLNGVSALSGYLEADSGRRLAFSILVNDRPASAPGARTAIFAALETLAAEH